MACLSRSILAAASVVSVALAAAAPGCHSAGGGSCDVTSSGSVLLQQRQVHTPEVFVATEAEELEDDDEGLVSSSSCCVWARSEKDMCGSCESWAPSGSWCAKSEQHCKQCGKASWCGGGGAASPAPRPRPRPGRTPAPAPASTPRPVPPVAPGRGGWDGENMKMTHYWDCSGQGCDAATLQPWNEDKYISPPGYGPQDPQDFGGPMHGEVMWLTGAASDALSALMGDDDGCCGGDPNDGGVGGCGKCALVQNPDSLHPEWTAVVMKKNRCPPWSNGCGAGEPHFDVAAPGFDNLQWSTANVCGIRPGTGFQSQEQSASLGSWWSECSNTADCAHLCDKLPSAYRSGCKLFASWGWKKGNPSSVKFKAVKCPPQFVKHVSSQFGPSGPQ